MFSKHTPPQRGRIRVTVEYDAVFVKEMAVNAKDLVKWLATSPEREQILDGLFKSLDQALK